MMRDSLTEEERGAIRFLTSWPMICVTGIGIPGIFGTPTIFGLKSALVRDEFTLWVYWIMTFAFVGAALLAIVCRSLARRENGHRSTKIAFLGCVVLLLMGLAGSTLLCTLSNL
jgi:ABC-type Fe3+-siderophore transport system permease subunit